MWLGNSSAKADLVVVVVVDELIRIVQYDAVVIKTNALLGCIQNGITWAWLERYFFKYNLFDLIC